MSKDYQSGLRSVYRAKRKKTNLILNGLIIFVLALIVFVAYNIFFSGGDKASTKNGEPKTEETKALAEEDKAAKNTEKTEENEDTAIEENKEKDSEEASATQEEADNSQAVVTEGDGSTNVLKTIENPAWKPVGTSQTGEHISTYNLESVDWQEMLNAISYATGLDQSNMNVYWLGSDKTTANASIGTVYSSDQQQKYRVYIKWVDGEGWMPTKVEELAELER
jgi:ABC-type Na+ efflux pump permease subunit